MSLTSWWHKRRQDARHARVDALVAGLTHPDAKRRANAAIDFWGRLPSLAMDKRQQAEQALRTAAWNDLDGLVRANAVVPLLQIGSPGAIDVALDLLHDPDWAARTLVATFLGKVRDDRVAASLIPLLHDPDGFVREAAAASLGEIGDPAALGPLRELAGRERKDLNARDAARKAVALLERQQT